MKTSENANESDYTTVAGMKLVYDPKRSMPDSPKKHCCADCHFCQFCSDARCNACRGERKKNNACSLRKLSLHEQIALYEKINAHENQS